MEYALVQAVAQSQSLLPDWISILQEEPVDPTGQAPQDLDSVEGKESARFWCNPDVQDCGWASWGNWISPDTALKIYLSVALWQVGVATVIWDRTINERLFVDGEVNKDPYLVDFVWLIMVFWHYSIFGAFAFFTSTSFANSTAWIDGMVLLFANISMLGVLFVYPVIAAGLAGAATKDDLWDVDGMKTEIIGYSASAALCSYFQIETINGVRRWYYRKEYTADDLKGSFCEDNNGGEGCEENLDAAQDAGEDAYEYGEEELAL